MLRKIVLVFAVKVFLGSQIIVDTCTTTRSCINFRLVNYGKRRECIHHKERDAFRRPFAETLKIFP